MSHFYKTFFLKIQRGNKSFMKTSTRNERNNKVCVGFLPSRVSCQEERLWLWLSVEINYSDHWCLRKVMFSLLPLCNTIKLKYWSNQSLYLRWMSGRSGQITDEEVLGQVSERPVLQHEPHLANPELIVFPASLTSRNATMSPVCTHRMSHLPH